MRVDFGPLSTNRSLPELPTRVQSGSVADRPEPCTAAIGILLDTTHVTFRIDDFDLKNVATVNVNVLNLLIFFIVCLLLLRGIEWVILAQYRGSVFLVQSFCSIGTILPPRPARAIRRRAQRRSRMARLRATSGAKRP